MKELFIDKKDCCACTACVNVCPQQAIAMKADHDGFIYPEVNNDLCIECDLCKKVCAFQNITIAGHKPLATYAAINKNKDLLLSSASGGIFGALAVIVLEKKGVVFGCAYNEEMEPHHIYVDNLLDINKIQGSKYVQSNIKNTYAEAKKFLQEGKWVLFTGTPCQIAGLKSFLGKDYNNLLSADIVCHGVPSAAFFKGYIKYLEDKLGGKVTSINFRDKSRGGGHIEKVVYEKNNIIKEKLIQPFNSYYHNYFLKGDILRENCYECKYACGSREGDFSMGDYWGVEKAHPEIETEKGVSVLLVNTRKGMNLIGDLNKHLDLTKSIFEQAQKQNGQLNRPTARSDRREAILKTWREGGHQSVADEYYRNNKQRIILFNIKLLIPQSVKKWIKSLIVRAK